jgi:hypothetical protein
MFAVYRLPKNGTDTNYRICSSWYADYETTLNLAQKMYELDSSYIYEVRRKQGV